uniref:CASP-like protein n=1 Tax=Kalanchoe fedtschenkoi TaxID=63787 RepID=A0A7N1A7A8_KALFE
MLEATPSLGQQLATPSPFSVTRSSSRHTVHLASLLPRATAVIFSFASALSLARPPTNKSPSSASFFDYPELVYCFFVIVLAFGYSALQLIKGIIDVAHLGFIVSEKVSDYTTFVLDQLVSYLLLSSCSVSILATQRLGQNPSLQVRVWTSVSMSFATFFVVASGALLSGYRLCKRLIW